MRPPQRRRPRLKSLSRPRPQEELDQAAAQASYVGSGEHKTAPVMGIQPKPRIPTAAQCDPRLGDRQQLTDWLRAAIRSGRVDAQWEGGFPRYVWHRVDSQWYVGRLTNAGLGQYKGYPVVEATAEVPRDLLRGEGR
jgi:hypothetical protein